MYILLILLILCVISIFIPHNDKKYNFSCLDKNLKEYEIDKILGKQIMTHLEEFFNKSLKNKTRRNLIKKNRTKRKY